MSQRSRLLLVVAVVLPALLVGAAVLAAGVNAGSAVLAAGAAACLAALQAGTLVQVRRSNRIAAAARRQSSAVQPTADVAPVEVTWRSGVPVPPEALRFMGEDEARFVTVAGELADTLVRAGMTETAAVLDVGSGYGRLAAGLLGRADFRGSYLGFDILRKHVDWCTTVITAHDPRFRFVHLDVVNERYNPRGTISPDEMTFPAADAAFDVCALFSVFTHMYRPGIEHYLAEIARTLRPGGIAVTTWLLFDEARVPAVTSEAAAYALVHQLDDGARFMSTEDPLHAIGYPQDHVEAMARTAGLTVERVQRGRWAGDVLESPDASFQDVVVLRRP